MLDKVEASAWSMAGCVATALLAALVGQTEPNIHKYNNPFPPVAGKQTLLVRRVVDGDTVEFFYLIGPEKGRLYGCDAPEARTEAGKASAEAMSAIIKPVNLVNAEMMGRDKYGRAMVKLFDADGRNVTDLLIGSGKAVPWDGKGGKP